jgi:hypothetical protein
MPRGDKSSYTDKQKRQAEHIEEGYEQRGIAEKEAGRIARGPPSTSRTMAARRAAQVLDAGKIPPRRCKGGRLGGRASASRPGAERSRSAKEAATRRARPG